MEQQLSVMSPEEEEARQSLRTQYEAPLHTAHPYHSHMCASRSFVLRHTRALCHALLTQERRSCMSRRDQSAQMCAVCTVHWSHARHTLPSLWRPAEPQRSTARKGHTVAATVWVRGCRLVWLSSMRSSRSGGRRRLCTCTNPSQEVIHVSCGHFRLQRSQTICAAKSHSSHSWTRSSHLRVTHTSAMPSSSTCPRRPLPSTSSAPLPLPRITW